MGRSDRQGAGGHQLPRPSPLKRRPGFLLSPFRPFHLWKGQHFAPLAGILVGLIFFLLSLTSTLQLFEWSTLDMRFKQRGPRPIRSDLAVVFIGDDSIRAFGRWPWSWDHHAQIVDVLKRHGAREVLFDILFAESPSDSDRDLFAMATRSAGNVYLSSYFNGVTLNPERGWPSLGESITEPVPGLREAARGLGHCNATPDEDGITRRVPLLLRYSGGYYPSTALRVALDRLGVPLERLIIEPGKWIELPVPGARPLRIPIDDEGLTMVNFAGDIGVFEAYSALQVLQSDLFPEQAPIDLSTFRGKTVLVGVTFAGNTDIRPTPFSKTYPLLCILGNLYDNIMQRDFIHRPSPLWRLLAAVALGGLTAFLAYVLRPFFSLAATALLLGGTVAWSSLRFNRGGVWVDLIAPLGIILANYLVMTTVQYIQNRREKMQYLEHLKYMDDLVESSTDAIVSFDTNGTIVTWNRGATAIFGWSEREALGKRWDLLLAPERRPAAGELLAGVLGDGTPRNIETTGARHGREEFPAQLTLSPVEDSHGALVGVSCIAQDLTEKKKMIEMLIQSEKMAELGRLGSGIVHEIKNPLTSIMMLTGMVLGMKNLEPKAQKYIGIIDQEAQRILRLSQNILSFARPKKPEMKDIELNKIIEETLSLVEYELKKNKVILDLVLAEGGLHALGDDEKLKQVFLNLVINSIHAMEGGGTLRIATTRGTASPAPLEGFAHFTFGPLAEGEAAVMTITDQGGGIRPELLEKIFDPFFTTKAEGKGTGLGLYITRTIVNEHQGRLTVQTKVGAGTTFTIALPLPGETASGADEPHPA